MCVYEMEEKKPEKKQEYLYYCGKEHSFTSSSLGEDEVKKMILKEKRDRTTHLMV